MRISGTKLAQNNPERLAAFELRCIEIAIVLIILKWLANLLYVVVLTVFKSEHVINVTCCM